MRVERLAEIPGATGIVAEMGRLHLQLADARARLLDVLVADFGYSHGEKVEVCEQGSSKWLPGEVVGFSLMMYETLAVHVRVVKLDGKGRPEFHMIDSGHYGADIRKVEA